MSEKWVQSVANALKTIQELEVTDDIDRLELVRLLRIVLFVLHRTIDRWIIWSSNYAMISDFDASELTEIVNKLTDVALSWVEHDLALLKKLNEKPEPHVV